MEIVEKYGIKKRSILLSYQLLFEFINHLESNLNMLENSKVMINHKLNKIE